jgi:hypothetical protein
MAGRFPRLPGPRGSGLRRHRAVLSEFNLSRYRPLSQRQVVELGVRTNVAIGNRALTWQVTDIEINSEFTNV